MCSTTGFYPFVHVYDDGCHPFTSRCRNDLRVSFRNSLVMRNYFSFCLLGKDFILPLFMKDNFTMYSIFGGYFLFLFSTLNISSHSMLAYKVSSEKFTARHIGTPLCSICFISLAADFRIIFCL